MATERKALPTTHKRQIGMGAFWRRRKIAAAGGVVVGGDRHRPEGFLGRRKAQAALDLPVIRSDGDLYFDGDL